MADANSKVFVNDDSAYNKEIKAVPTPEKEIGIDTKEYIFQNIINAGTSSVLDIGEIESFSMASKSRDQVYRLLDTMAEDSAIAAVLETYAEDATEYNDQGKIVWVEASNSNIASYVNYLLKTLCVDKNIYGWVYSLCKYGDLYLRLYRTSDYTDLLFDPKPTNKLDEKIDTGEIVDKSGKEPLNEAVKIKAYAKSDKYVRYIEMVPNPAEVFELTRFGKTAGYIQVDLPRISSNSNFLSSAGGYYRYKFNRGDINLYSATEFVHACLEDNSSRVPEEVDIFVENYEAYRTEIDSDGNIITKSTNTSSGSTMSYKVKRGQSLLYSVYKVWRELMLLENSVLLNRVTKSSIVRVIGVEVGDMPKEMVGPHLQGIKQMIEQKAAIDVGVGMGEYTNPGPIENNIYVPTHGGVGAISTQQIGGDVDVKGLADLDYYLNKFYGTLRVPKQYFAQTDDSTGFNGGTSLSIISSRYAKMIKRIQNTIIQALTDAVNLMLLDSGLDSYVNNFTLRMQSPTTQEEKDRQENTAQRVQLVSDVMNLVADIENPIVKLKMLKSLLANAVTNTEITTLLNSEIQKMEQDERDAVNEEVTLEDASLNDAELGDTEISGDEPLDLGGDVDDTASADTSVEVGIDDGISDTSSESASLPTPDELGVDMTAPESF